MKTIDASKMHIDDAEMETLISSGAYHEPFNPLIVISRVFKASANRVYQPSTVPNGVTKSATVDTMRMFQKTMRKFDEACGALGHSVELSDEQFQFVFETITYAGDKGLLGLSTDSLLVIDFISDLKFAK